ncbi:hypothetical protein FRB94_000536 [Tulasnella sp. JGI-2019a]|nr:hypothetical protein FRB94_000536 [Tulasnella sp. JGI-2019a]
MFPSLLALTRPEDPMETRLERVLDRSIRTPMTTGVIIINDINLCVGFRGELAEKDAMPIAALIAKATDRAEEYKGQINYQKKRLQFHKTPGYTFALLRSPTPPPTPSPPAPSSPVVPVGLSLNLRSPGLGTAALAVSPNAGTSMGRSVGTARGPTTP